MTIARLDIPEHDQIPSFRKILDDLSVNNNVFLVGSAGTGKTTLAESIAYARAGRKENDGKALPFITITCNQWTSPIDIKGGQTIEGYKEGGLIDAWREGKLLILDEMPKLDANTAGLLNDALAKTAKDDAIIFNGLNQPVKKHPGFACIATGNTLGKGISTNYVGNNKQDASLLDRFSSAIYQVGFNEALERKLIYPAIAELCINIRKAILRYEAKDEKDQDTEDIMTLRTMLNIQRIYELEMLRLTGSKDRFGVQHDWIENGKTTKDAIESFFLAMNKDKAIKVMSEANVEAALNTYNSKTVSYQFMQEYRRKYSLAA